MQLKFVPKYINSVVKVRRFLVPGFTYRSIYLYTETDELCVKPYLKKIKKETDRGNSTLEE